jgi:hypothetical protein
MGLAGAFEIAKSEERRQPELDGSLGGRHSSMKYSDKTVAELCRALGAVIRDHFELELVFLEHGVPYDQFGGGIRPRVNGLVMLLRSCDDGDARLTQLIEYALLRRDAAWEQANRLLQALRLDGCEWRDGTLIPTTPEPLPLAQELSQLERDLQDLSLSVAATHYRQAYESFVAGRWEAANGQVRSFAEDFFIEVGRLGTSKSRPDPLASLQDLRSQGFLDDPEWQTFRGFWQSIQDKGPHHGLSDEQEALFRLHLATAIARYIIHKLARPRG